MTERSTDQIVESGKKVQLRSIPNLVAPDARICEPWNYQPNIPPEELKDKETFRAWESRRSTNHCFYSGIEAINAAGRANKPNPPHRVHALIADFDAKVNEGMMQKLGSNCDPSLEPNWTSRTFSGGARAMWLLEEPMLIDNPILFQAFLNYAMKELCLKRILPGLDEGAWKRPTQYYEVGKDWQQISTHPIPASVINYWLVEAAANIDGLKLGDLVIPLDVIKDEIEDRWPGRWEGDFEIGSRGVAFFNPGSNNPSAAVVKETGMICYNTDQLFHSWESIFGRAFVKKYEADKIGRAASNVYFDGKQYWTKNARGEWNYLRKDDFAQQLRVRHGVSCTKQRGETASEADKVLDFVQEHRRVVGAAPKVYCQEELFYENGKKYLNISRVRVMPPAAPGQEWGVNFPWLAGFFDTCWSQSDPSVSDAIQKNSMLAWLKRFYAGGLSGSPSQGQALFLAGPPGTGKTLMTGIVSLMVGGSALAGQFLMGDTSFNKEMLEIGLWVVDDNVAAQDPKVHQRFSELIKQSVANCSHNYHPKGIDAVKVSWSGRLMVALNDDEIGIRLLPVLGPSIEDKLIILQFSDALRKFEPRHELEAIIKRELPYLCSWLLEWQPPDEVAGSTRFGCKSYIHPDLRLKAMNSSGLSDVLEVVNLWIKVSEPAVTLPDLWEGTAAELLSALHANEHVRPLAAKFSTQALGRKLSQAAGLAGTIISRVAESKHKGDGAVYQINRTREFRPAGVLNPAVTMDAMRLSEVAIAA